MVKFFSFEEPFYIFLIVPIYVSTLTTSNKYLLIINQSTLLIFDLIYLTYDKSYIDAWVLLIMLLFSICFITRNSLNKLISSNNVIVLEGLQKYIYDRDFKDLFTEDEFLCLMNLALLKKTVNKKNLAVEGECFDKIIYLATIPSYPSIVLKTKNTVISYLHEGSWLGVVEFILYYDDNQEKMDITDNNKWLVSLDIEKDDVEITYYEWDFISMTNLVKYSGDNQIINKLLLVWTKYLTHSVLRLDDHVANTLKAIIYHDKPSHNRMLPLCIIDIII